MDVGGGNPVMDKRFVDNFGCGNHSASFSSVCMLVVEIRLCAEDSIRILISEAGFSLQVMIMRSQ